VLAVGGVKKSTAADSQQPTIKRKQAESSKQTNNDVAGVENDVHKPFSPSPPRFSQITAADASLPEDAAEPLLSQSPLPSSKSQKTPKHASPSAGRGRSKKAKGVKRGKAKYVTQLEVALQIIK
jgi:hypothetical protein